MVMVFPNCARKERAMAKQPTQAEIDEVRNLASEQIDKGGTAYSGMSYEDGVAATLDWLDPDMDMDAPLP